MFLLMNLSISLQNSFKYSNKGTRFASRKNTKSSDKPEFADLSELLVETKRIELSTLRMRTVRSPS